MPLSRTGYTPEQESFPSFPFTTDSYTFPSGQPVAVVVTGVNEVGAENPAALYTIGDTGAGLVWTPRVLIDNGGSGDYMAAIVIFTAIGNGTACTLQIDKSGSGVGRLSVKPYTWSGAHASAPFGATMTQPNAGNVTDGALSGTLSVAPASTSEVLAVLCGTFNGMTAADVTHGTGWSEDYQAHQPDYMMTQTQFRTGSTSTTVLWDDVLAAGIGWYRGPAAAALEIIAAEEGGGPVLRKNSLMRLGVGR